VSYVAYHFHWPLAEILDMEHPMRQAFVNRIARINERISGSDKETETDGW
jgi:hypothetical protein